MPGEWFWIGVIVLLAAALILPRLVPEPIPSTQAAAPTPLAWNPERRRWTQSIVFGGGVIEVCLDGDATGPSADAMGGWLDLRSQLDEVWQSVIRFAIRETAQNGVQMYEPDEFGLSRVDLCPEDPFGGGDTVFTFEVASDPGTTFIVPMRDGRMLSLQRAS
ncbi:MAG TPA: hypothetical protein VLB44_09655 [Kofleriaceae bacterium]|nr:hypothetical protein [Kofleriaceae bacterium]